MTTIYTLADPRNGEVRYIGKTAATLKHRYGQHIYENLNTHKCNWIKSLKSVGLRPVIEELEKVEDEEWKGAERFWIESLRQMGCRLTNIDSGGWGGTARSQHTKNLISAKNSGKIRTEETKRKISAAKTGVPAVWNKGRVMSEETKQKISAAKKGITSWNKGLSWPDEIKLKMSAARKGHPVSLEHRKKLSEATRAAWAAGKPIGKKKKQFNN